MNWVAGGALVEGDTLVVGALLGTDMATACVVDVEIVCAGVESDGGPSDVGDGSGPAELGSALHATVINPIDTKQTVNVSG